MTFGLEGDERGPSPLSQGPEDRTSLGLLVLLPVRGQRAEDGEGHKGGLKPSAPNKVIKGHEGVLPCAHPLPEPQLSSVLSSRSREPSAKGEGCQHSSCESCQFRTSEKGPMVWSHKPTTALQSITVVKACLTKPAWMPSAAYS